MIATALGALGGGARRRCRSSTSGFAPPRAGPGEFCWHIDIVPRLATRAGFELGTGVEINIYPPERAAADLRAALAEGPR